MFPETLRVPLNELWAEELKVFLLRQRAEAPPPRDIEGQVLGVFQAGYCRDLGLLRYAEGAPMAEVRHLFRLSVEYILEVFRHREEMHEDGQFGDASLTNSLRGRDAMELALACGALDLARSLAPLVWDPLGASYLGRGSVVCTQEQQQSAYALRDLLLDRPAEALKHIHALEAPSGEEEDRPTVLSALARGDGAVFRAAIGGLHARHLDRVAQASRLDSLEDLLDVPALAYLALGSSVFPEAAPLSSDPFLPLDLLRNNQGGL